MQPILYKTNKKKVALMFGIFAVATPLSAIAAYFAPRILNFVIGPLPIILVVLIYLILVVSIIGFIAGLLRLLSNRFDLLINETGIQNNAEFGAGKIIRWSDIERISIESNGLNKGIAVFLKNPQAYVDSFTGLKKQGVGLLNLKYGTPCVINVQALKGTEEEIFGSIEKYLSHYKNQNP